MNGAQHKQQQQQRSSYLHSLITPSRGSAAPQQQPQQQSNRPQSKSPHAATGNGKVRPAAATDPRPHRPHPMKSGRSDARGPTATAGGAVGTPKRPTSNGAAGSHPPVSIALDFDLDSSELSGAGVSSGSGGFKPKSDDEVKAIAELLPRQITFQKAIHPASARPPSHASQPKNADGSTKLFVIDKHVKTGSGGASAGVKSSKSTDQKSVKSTASTGAAGAVFNPTLAAKDFIQPQQILFSPQLLPKIIRFPAILTGGGSSGSGSGSGGRPIGCGLQNLGNTCFFNSCLQAITHTPPFAHLCLAQYHSKKCKVSGWCLFCELERQLARSFAVRHNPVPALAPVPIVRHLKAISKTFRIGRQEDSHEAVRFVLDTLQNNVLAPYPQYVPPPHTSSAAAPPPRSCPLTYPFCCFWCDAVSLKKEHRIKETSEIYAIWGGYLRSQVKCTKCNYESNTYDPFLDLSLEVFHCNSVIKALKHFTAVEVLDADNKYNCKRCNRKVIARKQLSILKPPTCLTIHLKRFQFANAYGGKIGKPIDFEEKLNLAPFLSHKQV